MALPSSGTITMGQVKTEFGGPNTLSSYLKDSAYVKSIPPNSNVPTSLPLRLTDLYGATKLLDTQTVSNVGFAVAFGVTIVGYLPDTLTGSPGPSISDGTSNAFGGATITALFWRNFQNTEYTLNLRFGGTVAADSSKYLYPSNGIGNAKQFSNDYRTYYSSGNYTEFRWITASGENPFPVYNGTVAWYFY